MSDEFQVGINIKTSADKRSLEELNRELKTAETNLRGMAATDARWSQQAAQVSQLKTRIAELNAQTKPLADAQDKVTRSGANMGQALLQSSRGIQDFAAAGLPGIVNNLELMAASLGLGAGAAGAVTVLAVAIQTLGPQIVAWFKSLDTSGKTLNETRDALQSSADTLLEGWNPETERAKANAAAFAESLAAEREAVSKTNEALQVSVDLLRERAKLEGENDKATTAQKVAAINARTDLTPEQKQGEIARVQIDALNADKARREGLLTAEMAAANLDTSNKEQTAQRAAERAAALRAEKMRAEYQASLAEDIGGVTEQRDADGKITREARPGALQRTRDAEQAAQRARDSAAAARIGGVPEAIIQQGIRDADDKARQERTRLDDLTREMQSNVDANGGSTVFRPVATINAELQQASKAAAEAQAQAQAANQNRNALTQRQGMERERIARDYNTEADRITAPLAEPPRARVQRDYGQSNPFDAQQQQREQRAANPRDLYAEEKARGVNDAETAKATQEAAHAQDAANQATLAALAQLKKQAEEMAQKLKSMRSP